MDRRDRLRSPCFARWERPQGRSAYSSGTYRRVPSGLVSTRIELGLVAQNVRVRVGGYGEVALPDVLAEAKALAAQDFVELPLK